jgi:hypothetical protein
MLSSSITPLSSSDPHPILDAIRRRASSRGSKATGGVYHRKVIGTSPYATREKRRELLGKWCGGEDGVLGK